MTAVQSASSKATKARSAGIARRTEPGAYQDFRAGVAAALRHGLAMPVNPEDAIAALETIEAVRDSAGLAPLPL